MPKTVMVVDDDNVSREMVRRRLEQNNYTLLVAMDGEEALSLVSQKHPDLILLDVEMPKMNGYMFLTNLRKNPDPALARTPVMVLTGHTENEPIFRRHAVKGYITKPIDMEKLLLKIKEVLGE